MKFNETLTIRQLEQLRAVRFESEKECVEKVADILGLDVFEYGGRSMVYDFDNGHMVGIETFGDTIKSIWKASLLDKRHPTQSCGCLVKEKAGYIKDRDLAIEKLK